jgi:hypothetical protein
VLAEEVLRLEQREHPREGVSSSSAAITASSR